MANLKAEKARIEGQGKNNVTTLGALSKADRTEMANGTCDFEKALCLSILQKAHVVAIERALEKAVEGTYSICDVCQGLIEPARHEALPEATDCIKCHSKK